MSVIDWDAIEIEYAKGVSSNREIATQFNISEGAIRKRAKQYAWSKDLTAKIKLKAQQKVRTIEYASHGTQSITKATEQELVESEANLQALALIGERASIKRLILLSDTTEAMMVSIKNDPEKHAKCTKLVTDTREKIFNLYRRNLNINDNALGNADKKDEAVINMPPVEYYKNMIGKT